MEGIPSKRFKFLLEVIDPVHIGAGGYRLGRVDNIIIREPSTRLPKIPGTSINGASRFFADLLFRSRSSDKKTSICAGTFDEKNSPQCNEPEQCPICYTFGYTRKNEASMGTVSFSDGNILFFPVYTFDGVFYLTTIEILKKYLNLKVDLKIEHDKFISNISKGKRLNLGWLYLENQDTLPNDIIKKLNKTLNATFAKIDKFAIISEKLFSIIVNDNLEVRTSIAIDPITGATKEGALFTYEAIPRSTILITDIYEHDYKSKFKEVRTYGINLNSPIDVVKESLQLFTLFGFGGMKTRGFGRINFIQMED